MIADVMSDTKGRRPEHVEVGRKQLRLTVAICTFGEDGGRRLEAMNLPRNPRVDYVVSWQEGEGMPVPEAIAKRDDIRIVTLPGRGLSKNRNNVLEHAKGDIVLIADDDLRYYEGAFDRILDAFERRPEMEYASFEYDSDVAKVYPEGEVRIGRSRLPKYFYQTSFEVAIRRCSRAGRLRFPEGFGLGAPRYNSGEEELFLKRARLNGIDIRHIPLKICFHPGPTTGVRGALEKGTMRAIGLLTAVEYPFTAVLRVPLAAVRFWRRGQASLAKATIYLTQGAVAGYFSRNVRKYLNSPL